MWNINVQSRVREPERFEDWSRRAVHTGNGRPAIAGKMLSEKEPEGAKGVKERESLAAELLRGSAEWWTGGRAAAGGKWVVESQRAHVMREDRRPKLHRQVEEAGKSRVVISSLQGLYHTWAELALHVYTPRNCELVELGYGIIVVGEQAALLATHEFVETLLGRALHAEESAALEIGLQVADCEVSTCADLQ